MAGGTAPGDWRDWAGGLPDEVLAEVAETLVARTEVGWAAELERWGGYWSGAKIQKEMAKRRREGNCLFVFALVCKGWRKAQLRVGGPLRSRANSDAIAPGRVALAKWALAEGCPRDDGYGYTMAHSAARYGHLELVRWLCRERGFAMNETVMASAASSGNLGLVRWLRGSGCKWDYQACLHAVYKGHVEVLRWARANGCPWTAYTRDRAAEELGYTDDFGHLVL